MRWIKHLSMAHKDRAMSAVLEDLGPDAYGVYWLIIENIAAVMDKEKMVPELVYSDVQWAHITHCSPRRFRTIAQRLQQEKLISCETESKRLKITVPNILKYKDEYSKKSGHCQDSKADREAHTETDRESEDLPTDEEAAEYSDWAEGVYERHPKKKDKFLGLGALQLFRRDKKLRALFDKNHLLMCESVDWKESGGKYAPTLQKFVEDDAWKQAPSATVAFRKADAMSEARSLAAASQGQAEQRRAS